MPESEVAVPAENVGFEDSFQVLGAGTNPVGDVHRRGRGMFWHS